MYLFDLVKVGVLAGLLTMSGQIVAQSHADTATENTSVSTNAIIMTEKTVAQTPAEDALVTEAVKKQIAHSKMLSGFNIDVSTKDGVVSYTGTVESDTQASLLIQLAESVIGVANVDTSKLVIKSGQSPVGDALITAKIKGILIREKLFGEKNISAVNTSVETKDGVVYLSGVVSNKQQIDNAINVIRLNVPEVKKVVYSVNKQDTKM